jgi:hypothetical protein
MCLVIVGLLSLAFGVLALIGLLELLRELFCDSSSDANFRDAGAAIRRVGDLGASGRCRVMR